MALGWQWEARQNLSGLDLTLNGFWVKSHSWMDSKVYPVLTKLNYIHVLVNILLPCILCIQLYDHVFVKGLVRSLLESDKTCETEESQWMTREEIDPSIWERGSGVRLLKVHSLGPTSLEECDVEETSDVKEYFLLFMEG